MAQINKTPSLDDLDLFCQVIRHQSFAACAAHLGVSPAYVSKRLKMLEERLGVKLMHRTTRRVSLTEVGETVAEWGQRVLDQAQELVDAVSEVLEVSKAEIEPPPAFGAKIRADFIEGYNLNMAIPYVAAERGYVDDVIEPRTTRPYLIRALEMHLAKREPAPRRKHGNIPL